MKTTKLLALSLATLLLLMCGQARTLAAEFSITDFNSATAYSVVPANANSNPVVDANGDLILTDTDTFLGAMLWSETVVDMTNGFTATLEFSMDSHSDSGDFGADGFYLVMQDGDDPNFDAVGVAGGTRAYRFDASSAIANTVAIDINAWTVSRLSIVRANENGIVSTLSGLLDSDTFADFFNTSDIRTLTLTYDHDREILHVTIPDFTDDDGIAINANLVDILGTETVVFGVSAATGGAWQRHIVHSLSVQESEDLADPMLVLDPDQHRIDVGGITDSFTGTIELDNFGATETLTITSAEVQGPSAGDITIDTTLPLDIPAMSQGGITATWTPTGAFGPISATMVLTTNDPRPEMQEITIELSAQYVDAITEISYPDFSDTTGLSLVGSAAVSGTEMQLTTSAINLGGAIWAEDAFPLTGGFTSNFTLRFDEPVGDGADGTAFVIQGLEAASTDRLGALGDAIGLRDGNGPIDSIAIEFDTYTRSRIVVWHIDGTSNDIQLIATADAGMPFFEANTPREVTVAYNSDATELVITLDALPDSPVIVDVDIPSLIGDYGIMGFTAATGGASQIHAVESWTTVTGYPDVFLAVPGASDPVEFGAVGVETTVPLTVYNLGDSDDLVIDNTTEFGGADAASFRIENTFPVVIPAGGQAELNITFDPSAAALGSKTAFLALGHNDPEASDATATVDVTAIGVDVVEEISYPDFSDTNGLSLIGDTAAAGGVLDITPAANDAEGAAWFEASFNISEGFTSTFDLQFDAQGAGGADGTVFVLQSANNASFDRLGAGGGSLGYFGGANPPIDSIAIEFDTWQKSQIVVWYMDENGAATQLALLDATLGDPFFNDIDAIHEVTVMYDPGLPALLIHIPDFAVGPLFFEIDLSSYLETDNVVMGFTAATGGANQTHTLHNWSVIKGADFGSPAAYLPQTNIDPDVAAPTGSSEATIEVRNISSADPLVISDQTALSGANAGMYAIVTDLPLTIPAGESRELVVQFVPDGALGSYPVNLTVMNNSESPLLQQLGVTINGLSLFPASEFFAFEDFSDASDFSLNGNATILDDFLNIAPAVGSQAGSAWYVGTIDVSQGFTAIIDIQLTEHGSGGADGMGFVLQNAQTGSLTALGGGGGDKGYFGTLDAAAPNLPNSVAIMFDTWNNSWIEGWATNAAGTTTALAPPATGGDPYFNSDAVRTATIHYDHTNTELTVELTDFPVVFTADVDLVAALGSELAIPGFTAGTGGAWQNHLVRSWIHFSGASSDDPNALAFPDSLNLGLAIPSGGPVTGDVTVYNNGATQDLVLNPRVTGDSAALFGVEAPASIAPGSSGSIEVTFNPSIAPGVGTYTATLVVDSNDAGGDTVSIPITVNVPPNAPNLVAHYKMDETSGNTMFDASVNELHGTYVALGNGEFALGVDGLASGSAVHFTDTNSNGNAGYASIEGFPSLPTMSLSLWAVRDAADVGTVSAFANRGLGEAEENPWLFAVLEGIAGLPDNSLILFENGASNIVLQAPGAIEPATAHHLVIVQEDTNDVSAGADYVRLYVDGELVVESNSPPGWNDITRTSVQIGARITSSGGVTTTQGGLTGTIDDVQFYDIALTEEDIQFLYNNPGQVIAEETSIGDGIMPEAWLNQYGLTGAASLSTADPEDDGASNLTEYLFGMDPTASDYGNLGSTALVSDGGQDYLGMTYVRRSDDANASYEVQASIGIFGDWAQAGGTVREIDVTDLGDGLEQVTVVYDTPLDQLSEPVFLRVQATMAP